MPFETVSFYQQQTRDLKKRSRQKNEWIIGLSSMSIGNWHFGKQKRHATAASRYTITFHFVPFTCFISFTSIHLLYLYSCKLYKVLYHSNCCYLLGYALFNFLLKNLLEVCGEYNEWSLNPLLFVCNKTNSFESVLIIRFYLLPGHSMVAVWTSEGFESKSRRSLYSGIEFHTASVF